MSSDSTDTSPPIASQAWLAEFAWTEGDIPRKRSERASSLPPESFEHFCIDWWVAGWATCYCLPIVPAAAWLLQSSAPRVPT